MWRYIFKRLLIMIPTLIGITIISFVIIHLAPGKPTDMFSDLNPDVSIVDKQRLLEIYGLDKPIHIQYYNWLKNIIKLDFGQSLSPDRRLVIDKISERLPVTLAISVSSLILIFAFSLPLGITAAVRAGSIFDKVSAVLVFLIFALPSFWLAILFMYLFGIKLHWLPVSGISSLNYNSLSFAGKAWDLTSHLILPVLVSSIGGIAGLSRYMRSNMIEILKEDYLLTARSKGLSESLVIYKHALRNALLPIITILGLSVPGLIGGSVIIESIFSIPGLGQLFYGAIMGRDYPLIMGGLVISSFLTLIGNLLADVGYALADPRIRDNTMAN